MTSAFMGKWEFAGSENYDEYMKEIGVSLIDRKIANNVKPVETFTLDGDMWTLQVASTFRSVQVSFRLGEAVVYETPEKRRVTATFQLDGATLTETQRDSDSQKTRTTVRTVDNATMHVVLDSGTGAVSKRTYTKA